MVETLGKTAIKHGKHERNYFLWYAKSKSLQIDFDSDFDLVMKINLKNPDKALAKAKKIVNRVGDFTTVKELIDMGFCSNVPPYWYED